MPFVLLLLLMLAVRQAHADPVPVPDTDDLKAYAASVTKEGQSLAAFNFVQDSLYRPHLSAVTYDPASDRFYWKTPITGKLMSMDREQFFTDIWGPYSLWSDRTYLLSQAQQADPVQLAKTGDATSAFNYAQENREDAFKFARQEGRVHPSVDQVWYDGATQLFHWKGPKSGKEMSMGRDQFMKEIYYPYSLWIRLHNPS